MHNLHTTRKIAQIQSDRANRLGDLLRLLAKIGDGMSGSNYEDYDFFVASIEAGADLANFIGADLRSISK
jgi:hypothetical protein